VIRTTIKISIFALISFCLLDCTRIPLPPEVPGIYIDKAEVIEGDSDLTEVKVKVTLVPVRKRDIEVDYEIVSLESALAQLKESESLSPQETLDLNRVQEATADDDYVSLPKGTLKFEAGEKDAFITLSIKGDELYERREFIILKLSNTSVELDNPYNVVLIDNDDDAPNATLSVVGEKNIEERANEKRTIRVVLDKPSGIDSPFRLGWVSFEQFDGSDAFAIFRADYTLFDLDGRQVFTGDSFVVPPKTISADLTLEIIDDGIDEKDETLELTLFSTDSEDLKLVNESQKLSLKILANSESGHGMMTLNDTGSTRAEPSLGSVVEAQQDQAFGRDSSANSDADGRAGFSYTKLNQNGQALADQNTPWDSTTPEKEWSCVRDEVTGLIWEVKDSFRTLQYARNNVYWYDSDNKTNGSISGASSFSLQEDCETRDCNTLFYAAQINLMKLCGMTGWRLPTIEELRSLGDYGSYAISTGNSDPVAIDYRYFPTVEKVGMKFWSSTTSVEWKTDAYTMTFGDNPVVDHSNKSRSVPIARLVNDQQ